jgi:hypothetical protein
MLYLGRNYDTAFARAKYLCAKLCRTDEEALGVHMLLTPPSRRFTKVLIVCQPWRCAP